MILKRKNMKQTLQDYHGRMDETNMKYKNHNDERERILKSYYDAQDEVKRKKKENTKLHDLKYGRFNFH